MRDECAGVASTYHAAVPCETTVPVLRLPGSAAAARVIKTFAAWLEEQGYWKAGEANGAFGADTAAARAQLLPGSWARPSATFRRRPTPGRAGR